MKWIGLAAFAVVESRPRPPARVRIAALGAAGLLGIAALLAGVGYLTARIVGGRSRPADAASPIDATRPSTPEELDRLVSGLSSDDWATRSGSTRRLIEIGEPALARLERAFASGDPEAAWRAREAAREIEWRAERGRSEGEKP